MKADVVCCGDCKYSRRDYELYDGRVVDLVCCRRFMSWEEVEENDFCSRGRWTDGEVCKDASGSGA